MRHLIKLLVIGAIPKHLFPNTKEREQRRQTITSVFTKIATGLVVIVAFFVILVQLGVDIVALVAGVGALGVVIGLAGQSMFKEVYKGITLLLFDQMRIDDIVEIAGISGTVDSISLFVTRLRDLDGVLHHVPNSEITTVTNMSQGYANVNINIRVDYDTDIDLAEKIMNQLGLTLAKADEFKGMFIEPIQFLRVDSFDDVGINLKALGKVAPGEQWGLAAEYRRRILPEFKRSGIKIPMPRLQLDRSSK